MGLPSMLVGGGVLAQLLEGLASSHVCSSHSSHGISLAVVTEWCFELEFVVPASWVGLALWRVWAWPCGVCGCGTVVFYCFARFSGN
jgi:hypothetical protein